ncbi:hypothetical protein [Rubritalea tangerina]
MGDEFTGKWVGMGLEWLVGRTSNIARCNGVIIPTLMIPTSTTI